jgi:hypothetical protein
VDRCDWPLATSLPAGRAESIAPTGRLRRPLTKVLATAFGDPASPMCSSRGSSSAKIAVFSMRARRQGRTQTGCTLGTEAQVVVGVSADVEFAESVEFGLAPIV